MGYAHCTQHTDFGTLLSCSLTVHICVFVLVGAGYGCLALSIEGPSKVDIQTEDQENGTCKVSYCPTEPGNYIVSVRFAEEHIPGKKQAVLF